MVLKCVFLKIVIKKYTVIPYPILGLEEVGMAC